jgi:hypothetical protein
MRQKGLIVPTVYLLGFRGTGDFDHPQYAHEPALIKAGHVGLQLEGDERVFGFHPTVAAAEQAGGEKALIELLKEHQAQDGTVQEDTAIFQRARALAQQGERTTVWVIAYEFTTAEFEAFQNQLLDWYVHEKIFRYNFPKTDGSFNLGEYNCALFPKLLGLAIPSLDGNLRVYIEALKRGGTEWQP